MERHGMKLDSIGISNIALSSRVSILEAEQKRSACPQPGLCVVLQSKIRTLEDAKLTATTAAFSVWKMVVGTLVFLSSLGGFVWFLFDMIDRYFGKH